MKLAYHLATLTLGAAGALGVATAQNAAASATAPKTETTSYRTLYLANLTQQNDANDVVGDMRNMLPRAKIQYVPGQNAISIRGDDEEIALAQKILADLDRPRKVYRLVYTITETENSKRVGVQTYTLVLVPGGKTILKEGSRIPVVTGTFGEGSAANSQIQYLDIGLNIEASLDGYSDGVKLRTKVEQSSLAEEKPSTGLQDPVVRQTVLEGTATLVQGKPLVLGSLDIPGSTRHQEIQVVPEVVR